MYGGRGEDLRLGDPSQFRGETLNMVLLLLERLGGKEHGEVALLNTHLLNVMLEPFADLIPDVHRKRAQNEETSNLGIVLDHLGLEHNLLVPLWEVLRLGDGDTDNVVLLLAANNGKSSLLGSLCSLLSSKLGLLLSLLQGGLGGFLRGSAVHCEVRGKVTLRFQKRKKSLGVDSILWL